VTDALDPGAGSPADPTDRDRTTVRLMAARDPEGLRRLLADHGGRILGALRRELHQVLDASDIEGVLNQAAHRAWSRAATFDPTKGSLRTWFFTVARNCAMRAIQDRRRHSGLRYVSDLDDRHVPQPQVEGAPTEQERKFQDDFYACVDALPRLQRLVVLADLEAGGSAPADDLAKLLGTSRNAIYVSRTNARKAMRVRMEEMGHTGRTESRPSVRDE
jgi:RNA polymerase sigma-70 factor (ECF subfamily)